MSLIRWYWHTLRAAYYDHLVRRNHPDADVGASLIYHRGRADALAKESA